VIEELKQNHPRRRLETTLNADLPGQLFDSRFSERAIDFHLCLCRSGDEHL
jgi:hypothetical protein